MKEIEQIYFNDFGVAFHWKKNDAVLKDRIQMVFKETGFYLSENEVKDFAKLIDEACRETGCVDCCHRARCHKFLLKTPLKQVDLAVSKSELMQIKDLVEGTIFTIQLLNYLDITCKN
ncbi:hypothetical protein FMM05_18185 [Flavobacterium zepuense]|uniref:Uncharacterized protein n=1 Tax=Flavobacterium zepuense TaxID=2593302 RepID=A0A552UW19_9FLAO|nr:hypothetical protein [Flavobacterium zepuense]TRW22433.1 hypothetical protein FMM05_18185 [Flavobacterium zepuense]